MRIVPPYIPWPRMTVLASGVFELLGAIGLLAQRLGELAGIGLFLLTIAVTRPMSTCCQHAELFRVPYWALVLRLPAQWIARAHRVEHLATHGLERSVKDGKSATSPGYGLAGSSRNTRPSASSVLT